MKYGIVYFPSKETQDQANEFRMRYDRKYETIPPHITLRYPCEIDGTSVKDIMYYLEKVAQSNSPFHITLGNVGSFHPTNNIIYFKVSPNEQLISLNNQLYSDVLEETSEFPFIPHMTIGSGLSDAEHADVLGSLRLKEFHSIEVVDRFHLHYQLANGSWTVYETFHLSK